MRAPPQRTRPRRIQQGLVHYMEDAQNPTRDKCRTGTPSIGWQVGTICPLFLLSVHHHVDQRRANAVARGRSQQALGPAVQVALSAAMRSSPPNTDSRW